MNIRYDVSCAITEVEFIDVPHRSTLGGRCPVDVNNYYMTRFTNYSRFCRLA